ncbi:SDR family oxidoreductase, partial [Vibrio sp. 10N.286.51.F4]|uniref:SDR family oxidoreductase n=1 Tax=Vibrio sp. 10N.286.51.F4 TaxID=3229710 RepID=UPI00354C7B35
ARRIDRLQPLAEKGAKALAIDVRNESDVQAIFDKIMSEQSGIDIVYANAGYAIAGPVEDTSIEKAKQQLDTNLFGAARV